MPLYFCTPRGDVHFAPPIGSPFDYVERFDDGFGSRCARQVKPWGSLPVRNARDFYEARIDFMFDQAQKDVIADIRRMFRYAEHDRWALARRQQRLEYRQKHGWG